MATSIHQRHQRFHCSSRQSHLPQAIVNDAPKPKSRRTQHWQSRSPLRFSACSLLASSSSQIRSYCPVHKYITFPCVSFCTYIQNILFLRVLRILLPRPAALLPRSYLALGAVFRLSVGRSVGTFRKGGNSPPHFLRSYFWFSHFREPGEHLKYLSDRSFCDHCTMYTCPHVSIHVE